MPAYSPFAHKHSWLPCFHPSPYSLSLTSPLLLLVYTALLSPDTLDVCNTRFYYRCYFAPPYLLGSSTEGSRCIEAINMDCQLGAARSGTAKTWTAEISGYCAKPQSPWARHPGTGAKRNIKGLCLPELPFKDHENHQERYDVGHYDHIRWSTKIRMLALKLRVWYPTVNLPCMFPLSYKFCWLLYTIVSPIRSPLHFSYLHSASSAALHTYYVLANMPLYGKDDTIGVQSNIHLLNLQIQKTPVLARLWLSTKTSRSDYTSSAYLLRHLHGQWMSIATHSPLWM